MKYPFRQLTPYGIQSSTSIKRRMIEDHWNRANQCHEDVEKKERIANQNCKYCWYLDSGLAGQAFTDSPCSLCGYDMTFASTDVDRLCLNCAKTNKLCRHCGSDLELRSNRRKFPDAVPYYMKEGLAEPTDEA